MPRPITIFTGQWADLTFEEVCKKMSEMRYVRYDGSLSVEWEDSGMSREFGAKEALEFCRKIDFPSS